MTENIIEIVAYIIFGIISGVSVGAWLAIVYMTFKIFCIFV